MRQHSGQNVIALVPLRIEGDTELGNAVLPSPATSLAFDPCKDPGHSPESLNSSRSDAAMTPLMTRCIVFNSNKDSSKDGGPEDRWNGTFSTSGTSITFEISCPAARSGKLVQGYTATATELTLFAADGSNELLGERLNLCHGCAHNRRAVIN